MAYPVSFKWKKKLILEKYGLIGYGELLEQTNRFRANDGELVLKMLDRELECNKGNYYRVVLISRAHQYKLPNFVVSQREDLEKFKEFLRKQRGFSEIWYYIGDQKEEVKGLSGRISYNWVDNEIIENIEVVGIDNPRKIETYTLNDKDIDYLRASKTNWNSNPMILPDFV